MCALPPLLVQARGVSRSRRPQRDLDIFNRCEDGLERLRQDLEGGEWHRRNGDLLGETAIDFGYRIVVRRRTEQLSLSISAKRLRITLAIAPDSRSGSMIAFLMTAGRARVSVEVHP